MNFRKQENYLKVIRLVFEKYPHKHQEVVQDFHDWMDDKYSIPCTRELKNIIDILTKKEK